MADNPCGWPGPGPCPKHAKGRVFSRPTPWEAVSAVVVLVIFLGPIAWFLLLPWQGAAFVTFLTWPGSHVIVWGMVKHREWSRIVGGPSVSWAGRRYP